MLEPLLLAASLAGALWLVRAGLREPGSGRPSRQAVPLRVSACPSSGCPGCSHSCPTKRG